MVTVTFICNLPFYTLSTSILVTNDEVHFVGQKVRLSDCHFCKMWGDFIKKLVKKFGMYQIKCLTLHC